MPWVAAAIGVGGGLLGGMGDKRQADKMKEARKMAIASQIKMWKQAYKKSMGEFASARQDILGREQSSLGGVTGGLASSGLLNTTVGANMARGVRSDTNRSLVDLSSQRAASEYGKWMDLASIKGQTPYDNFAPQSQAESWGGLGAGLGQMMGGMDWSSIFGANAASGQQPYNTPLQE